MSLNSIAFVTTCKGRLHHIQQTLPTLVSLLPDEIVVVDYDCPDNVGEWVRTYYPTVKVVSASDCADWNPSRARNLGAANCTAEWICFIDADVKAKPDWLEWMRSNLDPRFYYRIGSRREEKGSDTWGTFICTRDAFETVEGFDEIYRGWGAEDTDIYLRLALAKVYPLAYPSSFVEPIRHDDYARIRFSPIKDKNISQMINCFYMEAKLQILTIQRKRGDLPLRDRQALMEMVRQKMEPWLSGTTQEAPVITFSATGFGWLPKPNRMLKKFYFTLSLDEVDMDLSGK